MEGAKRIIDVGIVAEGPGDQGVLTQIMKGLGKQLNVDFQIKLIRPDLSADRTDNKRQSSWTIIKKECECKEEGYDLMYNAFRINDVMIVIHLDSAECDKGIDGGYGVQRPPNKETELETYCKELRQLIIAKIRDEWMNPTYFTEEDKARMCFAITIEETEAWLLALPKFKGKKITDEIDNPKKTYLDKINESPSKKERQELFIKNDAHKEGKNRAKDFTDKNNLRQARSRNHSLHLFLNEAEAILKG